ncbi:PAS domain-containing protein [Streptomyces sp. NPDC046805]|uniref:PAS domain-containing protein n=1 Tax=Streptomyces sp. NPDC046805 TaxID=3155134 RepID=UPI0033DF7A28
MYGDQPSPEAQQPLLQDRQLEGLFTESPVGMYVFDVDLRLRRINAAAGRAHGVSTEYLIGRTAGEVYAAFGGDTVERILVRVLDSGEPVTDYELRGTPAGRRRSPA